MELDNDTPSRPCKFTTTGSLTLGETGPLQVRKTTILFYVEDGSIAIYQNGGDNLGYTGGMFFRRSHAYKDSGQAFVATDFVVGQSFKFLGRKHQVVDCDKHTREFFKVFSEYCVSKTSRQR